MTRALLAKVHIARKELAIQEESYRAILERITGCTSSKDCTEQQLKRLVAEFKRLGWKPKVCRASPEARPYVRKIYALWREAGIVGAVSNASKETLRAFVLRQTGKSAPEFLGPADANKVNEGIKAMISRAEERR